MGRKKNRLADEMAYLVTLGFTRLVGAVPRMAALAAGSAAGWLFWIFVRIEGRRLKVMKENLRNLYPEKQDKELQGLARKVFRHFGRFLADCGRLPLLDREMVERLVRFEGFENFREAYEKGRGVIFATAHFGHFEVANAAFAALGYPVWSVIREVDNRKIDVLFDDTRRPTGLGVIKKERSAGEILKHLREGAIVTINIDQNAAFNNIFVPFFGKPAATFVTPAVTSLRTGAPILPVFSFRDDENDSYTVEVHPPVRIEPTGDRRADIRLITMRINEILEDAIRRAPEQWLWVHRRWKTRPGEKDIEAERREMEIIRSAARRAGNVGAA
ncbi:MAG: lysophospholipid acyltransferase family protein [Candidatus Nitrospinota bacterium M3_3B_026]